MQLERFIKRMKSRRFIESLKMDEVKRESIRARLTILEGVKALHFYRAFLVLGSARNTFHIYYSEQIDRYFQIFHR